jgi:hypothetical protein
MTVPIRPGPSADQIEMDRAGSVGGLAERGPAECDPVEMVRVALGDRAYDIVIGRGLVTSLGLRAAALKPGAKAAIVTDDVVAPLHLAAAEAALAAAGIATSRVVVAAG